MTVLAHGEETLVEQRIVYIRHCVLRRTNKENNSDSRSGGRNRDFYLRPRSCSSHPGYSFSRSRPKPSRNFIESGRIEGGNENKRKA